MTKPQNKLFRVSEQDTEANRLLMLLAEEIAKFIHTSPKLNPDRIIPKEVRDAPVLISDTFPLPHQLVNFSAAESLYSEYSNEFLTLLHVSPEDLQNPNHPHTIQILHLKDVIIELSHHLSFTQAKTKVFWASKYQFYLRDRLPFSYDYLIARLKNHTIAESEAKANSKRRARLKALINHTKKAPIAKYPQALEDSISQEIDDMCLTLKKEGRDLEPYSDDPYQLDITRLDEGGI